MSLQWAGCHSESADGKPQIGGVGQNETSESMKPIAFYLLEPKFLLLLQRPPGT